MSKYGVLKIELNSEGVKELLKSQEIEGELQRQAEKIKSKVGGAGYGVSHKVLQTRAIASVYAATSEAIRAEHSENKLLKAIGGGHK